MSHWRRTRMISFRVSEREFEMLKTLSESEGARSVSDFARDALCGSRPGSAQRDPSVAFDELRVELEQLKTYVRRMAEILEGEPHLVNRASPVNDDRRERPPATAPGVHERAPLAALGRPAGRV